MGKVVDFVVDIVTAPLDLVGDVFGGLFGFMGGELGDEPGSEENLSATLVGDNHYVRIAYGRALVSGPVVYSNVSYRDNRWLWMLMPLMGHPHEAWHAVWLDGIRIPADQFESTVFGGECQDPRFVGDDGDWALRVYVSQKFAPDSTPVIHDGINPLREAFPDHWEDTDRGVGLSYMLVQMDLHEDTEEIWSGGNPRQMALEVTGKKVYDPRLDMDGSDPSPGRRPTHADNLVTSDNPALIWADYISASNDYGPQIAHSRIDYASVVTAADRCDGMVPVPGDPGAMEKRFTCNGVLTTKESNGANARAILNSMGGKQALIAGKYSVRAAAYQAGTVNLGEDDLQGDIEVRAGVLSDQATNRLQGSYMNLMAGYKLTRYPARSDLIAGELLKSATLNFPLVQSVYQAQRLALIRLAQQRSGIEVRFPAKYRGIKTLAGGVVNLTLPDLEWDEKPFRVRDFAWADMGGCSLTLREELATTYADPAVGDYIDPSDPESYMPDTVVVPPPTDVAATGALGGVWVMGTRPARAFYREMIAYVAEENETRDDAVASGAADAAELFVRLAGTDTRRFWLRAIDDSGRLSVFAPDDQMGVTAAPLATASVLDLRLQVAEKGANALVIVSPKPIETPDNYRVSIFEVAETMALESVEDAGNDQGFRHTFMGLEPATRYRVEGYAVKDSDRGLTDILYVDTAVVTLGGVASVVGISQTEIRATVPAGYEVDRAPPEGDIIYQWQYGGGRLNPNRWFDVPDTTVPTTIIGGARGNARRTVRWRTVLTSVIGTLQAAVAVADTSIILDGAVVVTDEELIVVGTERMVVSSSALNGDGDTVVMVRRGRQDTTAAAHMVGADVSVRLVSSWMIAGTAYTFQHPEAPENVQNVVLAITEAGIPTVTWEPPLYTTYPVDRYAVFLFHGPDTVIDDTMADFRNPYTDLDWTGRRLYLHGEYHAEVRAVSRIPGDDPNTGIDDLAGDWVFSNSVEYAGIEAITDTTIGAEGDESDHVSPSRAAVARALAGLTAGTTEMIVPTTSTLNVAIGAVAGADCYDWELRIAGMLAWGSGGTTTAPAQTLPSLDPNTQYEVRVMPVDKPDPPLPPVGITTDDIGELNAAAITVVQTDPFVANPADDPANPGKKAQLVAGFMDVESLRQTSGTFANANSFWLRYDAQGNYEADSRYRTSAAAKGLATTRSALWESYDSAPSGTQTLNQGSVFSAFHLLGLVYQGNARQGTYHTWIAVDDWESGVKVPTRDTSTRGVTRLSDSSFSASHTFSINAIHGFSFADFDALYSGRGGSAEGTVGSLAPGMAFGGYDLVLVTGTIRGGMRSQFITPRAIVDGSTVAFNRSGDATSEAFRATGSNTFTWSGGISDINIYGLNFATDPVVPGDPIGTQIIKSPLLGTWINAGTVTTPAADGTPGTVDSLALAIPAGGVPTVSFNKPTGFTGTIIRYEVRLYRDGLALPDASLRVTTGIVDAMSVTLPAQTIAGSYHAEVRGAAAGGLVGEWAASAAVEFAG